MSEDAILDMIEGVVKGVVNVNTLHVIRDYYNRRIPLQGIGSGWVYDKRMIITNAHVVAEAQKIGVTLNDGTLFEGRVRGICRRIDTAVIHVDHDLTPLRKGDSSKLRVGQGVYAVGNPFGLKGGPTVTRGVVSALNRTIEDETTSLQNLVQTDASINPGNSGGPLVDFAGNVVGVNTAIIPYAQGIGFATPINEVIRCVKQIEEHGAMVNPWIGVSGVTVTKQIAEYYSLSADSGFLVTGVTRDGPADRAGVEEGDIIVELGGKPVDGTEGLKRSIDASSVGDEVEATIVRGRGKGKATITIANAP